MKISPLARVTTARLVSRAGSEAAFFVGVWGKAAFGLHAKPTGLAILMFGLAVSAIVGNFLSGVLVDRYGPRRTLAIAEIVFVPAALALVLANTLPALIVLASIWAFVGAPVVTSGASFAPFLADDEEGLARVNSWIEGAGAASIAVGPAVGAIIVTYASWDWIFVLDAATSLAAAALVWPLPVGAKPRLGAGVRAGAGAGAGADREAGAGPEPGAGPEAGAHTLADERARKHPLAGLREGLRIAYGLRPIRYYVLAGGVLWMGFGAFGALEPLFFRDVVHTGVQALGWINVVFGVGLILGAAVLPRLPRAVISARWLAVLIAVNGLGVILYVGSSDLRVIAAGAFFWAILIGTLEPLLRTLVHRDSPQGAVGRVVGIQVMHQHGGELLPLAVAPALAAALGVQRTLIIGGLFTTVVALLSLPEALAIDRQRPVRHVEIGALGAHDEPISPNP